MKALKNIYLSIFLVIGTVSLQAQTQVSPTPSKNYVHTIVYKKGMPVSALGSVGGNDKLETIAYFDDLGRPIETLAIRQGGKDSQNNDTDLITPIEYDAYGRQTKAYMPYYSVATKGKFQNNGIAHVNSYYLNKYSTELNQSHPNPYSEKQFDGSPLNRVVKQAAPGEHWKLGSGHEIGFTYKTNSTNEVKSFSVSLDNQFKPTLIGGSYFPSTKLYKTITYDENHSGTSKNHATEEFKDKQGRVILKRTYNNNQPHDTYYVYDDYGNLTYVLPPLVNATSSGLSSIRAKLNELGYQYRYDEQNRLVEKKIAGKGWEYIVYNKVDQAIMTQDANLRAQHKWLFTKYDAFGRVAYTGITINDVNRKTMQYIANQAPKQWVERIATPYSIGGVTIRYSPAAHPKNINEILTINYYDDYSFNRDGLNVPSSTAYTTTIQGAKLKGLATGVKVKVLGTNQWITTVTGYDSEKRPVWVATKNAYLSTIDYVESKYKNAANDISGFLRETKTRHKKTGKADIVSYQNFKYDHSGKVLAQTHRIAGAPAEAIAMNRYDELGQLSQKKVGGTPTDELQVVDYKYNIRGWLTDINNIDKFYGTDLFAFRIAYDSPSSGTGLFNGNISKTQWKTKSVNPHKTAVSSSYVYAYDHLNRITSAIDNTGHYNLTSVSYDMNGNIKGLIRKGNTVANPTLNTQFGTMDYLQYTYQANSNKLVKVRDLSYKPMGFKDGANIATEYFYDQNGNMLSDYNKGITSNIKYNYLNLPTEIKFNNSNSKKIKYVYAADRTKLRKITNNNGSITTTDYAGGYIYENNSLKQISQPEGYIEKNGSIFQYIYHYKDHLGNVRLTYSDANKNGYISQSEIKREQNYYPFGLEHQGYNSGIIGVKNNLKTYQGQEFTEDLGLNTHEWKYRFSDPAIGRFWQIDPLAEDYVYNGVYNFAENRVIDGNELEGLEWVNINNKTVYDPLKNDGKGGYTKYATSDHKNLGRILNQSKKGQEQFSKLVNSTIPIQTKIDKTKKVGYDKNNNPVGGFTDTKITTASDLKGNIISAKVKSAVINIFFGSVDVMVDNASKNNIKIGNTTIDSSFSFTDIVSAIFGHEIEHTTDENALVLETGGMQRKSQIKLVTLFLVN